jgi:hypothetical protein
LPLLPVFWLQLGIHPASAETAPQRCAEIGRVLSADVGRDRAMMVPDSALLGALLDPARNDALEALGGFEAPEYYSGLLELEEHLGPATIPREVMQHPPLTAGPSLDAYDLRTRLDRVVVVKPAEKPVCSSITTLARDRNSQQISLSTPTLTCETHSAHVIRLKSGETFVALLDLPQEYLEELTGPVARDYGLALYGVGARDESTTCRFLLTTEATAGLHVEKANTINDMLSHALFAAGPASSQQEDVKTWLNHHGGDIAAAYLDKMSGRTADMAWPQDVAPDGITLADGPLDLSKSACGVFQPLPAGQLLRAIVPSISDLGGIRCLAADAGQTLHGRIKVNSDDFLVSVSSHGGGVFVNGYTRNADDGETRLAAVLWAKQIPSTHKFTVTRAESD